MELFPGIAVNPDVRFGKPCVAGTRVDVATVVGAIASAETPETVAEEYRLSVEQVQAALRRGSAVSGVALSWSR